MRRKLISRRDFHGSVDITDPCYDRDVWCRMDDVKIKDGTYDCVIWRETLKGEVDGKPHVEKCVGIIGIYLNGVIPPPRSMVEIGSIGVDAGLAGFFHNKPDYSAEEWRALRDCTRKGDAWLTEDGFFSYTGYGDGEYPVFAHKFHEEIVALEVRFL